MTKEYVTGERLDYDDWRNALFDEVLLGQECDDCGRVTGAPKAACAYCGNRDLEVVELPTEGEIFSETTIAVSPEGYDDGYQVALIQLGGARILARVDDGTQVEIGQEVELVDVMEAPDGKPAPVFG